MFTPNCDFLQAEGDPGLQIQALYLLVRCLVNLFRARGCFSRIIVVLASCGSLLHDATSPGVACDYFMAKLLVQISNRSIVCRYPYFRSRVSMSKLLPTVIIIIKLLWRLIPGLKFGADLTSLQAIQKSLLHSHSDSIPQIQASDTFKRAAPCRPNKSITNSIVCLL